MGLFSDIFISREEKAVVEIHNELANYWKNTNDFFIAHQRYIQDLNFKFKLNLSDELLIAIPNMIVTGLIMNNFSQKNTMYIFSQFTYFFIFGWQKPNRNRHTDEYILNSLEKIDEYIIRNQSTIHNEVPYILNKNSAKKLV
jgi:hypothetical protein